MNITLRLNSPLPRSLVGLAFLALAPFLLLAQPATLLLQHGFLGDLGTWESLGGQLSQQFLIDVRRYDSGASHSFPTQAATLASLLTGSATANALYVGHSNGGIVGRELVRQGKTFYGLLTIGSPHGGAPLAGSVIDGAVDLVVSIDLRSLAQAGITYRAYGESYWWVRAVDALNLASYIVYYTQIVSGVVLWNNSEILSQMRPGPAGYLAQLNSSGNLVAERSAVPLQIEVTSYLPNTNGIISRALGGSASDAAQFVEERDYVEGQLLGQYYHYLTLDPWEEPFAVEMQSNSWMWLEAAAVLLVLDVQYCALIGAYQFPLTCTPSDAVVPLDRQRLPNATTRFLLVDVAHLQDTSSPLTFAMLKRVLRDLEVPFAPLPPDPTFSVGSIQGPSVTTAGGESAFNIAASGGTLPYEFEWRVDGVLKQTGMSESFVFANLGASFYLTVRVTDHSGLSFTRSLQVTVSSCGGALAC